MSGGARAGRLGLGLLVLLACLAAVHSRELGSGFSLLPGGLVDTRIADAIQVHWRNVLEGREHWNQPIFFHPLPDTLGYQDGYLLFGLGTAALHAAGVDVLLAADLAGVPFRVAGFVGLYMFGREALRLPRPCALLAAALGVLSNGVHLQQTHQQLLAVYLAPVLAVLLWRAAARAQAGRPRSAGVHACAAALLLGAWALTAFYTLWFTALFGGLAILAAIARRPASLRPALRRLADPVFRLPLALGALSLVPFLLVYVPVARLNGTYPWSDTSVFLLGRSDLTDVGPGNLLGDALGYGGHVFSEHSVGLPPLLGLLGLGGAALAFAPGRPLMHLPLAAAAAATLLLAMRFGHHTAWRLVVDLVPGAVAVRVVCRVMLLLSLVAALLAAAAIAALRARGVPVVVLAVVAGVLVAEELDAGAPDMLPRAPEERFLARLAHPPAACTLFTLARARSAVASLGTDPIFAPMLAATDAMLVAELDGVPTSLGWGSELPPGYDPLMTPWQDAVLAGGGRPVCAADFASGTWTVVTPQLAALAVGEPIGFGVGGRSDAFVVGGWAPPEPGGRWTTSPAALLAFRWHGARSLVLHIRAGIGWGQRRHPRQVVILANGVPVATWPNDPAVADHVVGVPAGLLGPGGAVSLRLRMEGIASPASAGVSADARRLGVFVASVAAD